MYYLTGLPGWMRFGFSPGWVGRSPLGLGPCATYLLTGTWPTWQANYFWQTGRLPWPGGISPYGLPQAGTLGSFPSSSPQQEAQFLKDQANLLETQLKEIQARIKELEEKREGK